MTVHRTADSQHSQDARASNSPELLTITEAARIVRAPVATLRYWRHLGTGPHSFRLGRRVVYRAADLQTWIAKPTTPTPVRPSEVDRPPSNALPTKMIFQMILRTKLIFASPQSVRKKSARGPKLTDHDSSQQTHEAQQIRGFHAVSV